MNGKEALEATLKPTAVFGLVWHMQLISEKKR